MLRFRTKLLLLSIVVFGPGIGVLAAFADGAYSAVCLFALPIVVALASASVVTDFGNPPGWQTKVESVRNRGFATLSRLHTH